MQADIAVNKIKINQRVGCEECQAYTTGALVTLLDTNSNVMVEYRIGYVSSTLSFEIPYSAFY